MKIGANRSGVFAGEPSVGQPVRSAGGARVARRSVQETGLGGLLARRERWSPTWAGWTALVVGGALFLVWLIVTVQPFLAVTERTASRTLVIEGWVPNYALEEGIVEFKAGKYQSMITVGCDILNGVNVEAGDNHAGYAAKRLTWLGMDPRLLEAVPSPARYRDRTYASAVALRDWLQQRKLKPASINLMTVGAHARRTRLLFQKALGDEVRVGVIAVTDREYDPERWWQSSEGVKEVISEGVGYLYAALFFHPGREGGSPRE